MELLRLVEPALAPEVAQRSHLGGSDVPHHRHHSLPADRHHRQGQRVIAGEQREAGSRRDRARLIEAPRGFLDCRHPGEVLQLLERLGQRVRAGAARHVVEDERQVRALRHRPEVLDLAARRGLVVVGRHDHRAVQAQLLGHAGQSDRVGGGVRPGAGQDRHAPGDPLAHEAPQGAALLDRAGRRLSGGARHHQPLGSPLDQEIGEPRRRFEVERPVPERRHHRRD